MDGYELAREWVAERRAELIPLPREALPVHPDYLTGMTRAGADAAFRRVWALFDGIYADMLAQPAKWLLPQPTPPLDTKTMGEVRAAAWRPFMLLEALFTGGTMESDAFVASVPALRTAKAAKGALGLLAPLGGHGFVFEGLVDGRLPRGAQSLRVVLADRDMLQLLRQVAVKAAWMREGSPGWVPYADGFLCWHHRMLAEDMRTASWLEDSGYLADHLAPGPLREVIGQLHGALVAAGYVPDWGGWNEGPYITYYENEAARRRKSPYPWRLMLWMSEPVLMLRIRDAQACLPLLEGCTEAVRDMFRQSDAGCRRRASGECTVAVRYQYEGAERWHCACCSPAFRTQPRAEDIPDYFHLMAAGAKAAKK